MPKQLISTSDLASMRVVGGKNATKRIGKVRACLFHPKEKRCVGLMVKRPDLLWMFHRKDMFVALDGYDREDGRIVIHPEPTATDKAASKALGFNWNECVIWVGLPVITEGGEQLGVIDAVTFSEVSGKVDSLEVGNGATANALLGKRSVPANMVLGFRQGIGCALNQYEGEEETQALGAILVSDEAGIVQTQGGAAEKAGQASAVARDKAQNVIDSVKPKVSEVTAAAGAAVNKGAYATGKQIGRAKTMFSDFKKEYDKARNGK